MSFESGIRLKGAPKTRRNIAYDFEELDQMYKKFENERINKAQKLVGSREIKPDHLVKFVVERTNFCPHAFIDNQVLYWIETVSLLDGEMGLTLPTRLNEVPTLFFEALSIIRSARAKVRKEDRKE